MNQIAKRKFRSTQVASIEDLTPHLKRFVLSGNDLHDFPEGQDGVHVKAIFLADGSPVTDHNKQDAIKRSYTIREFDSLNKRLTLDFVVNRHQGPATNWAQNAKVGDYLGIGGPGERKLTNFTANSYLLIGDITAVNAVNGYAKFIPPEAALTAIVTVPTADDIIEMDAGDHLNVLWHVEDEDQESLLDVVNKNALNMAKNTQVFIGLEARQLREVKSLLLHDLNFDRLNMHATGYWKKGMDADRFGADKKRNPL
ncbi:siderophore-interacting protein [Aliiglaciecola sp. NS0011-25]|uniref:siderophore-interacting protein n=1 Tax=Aliiglaciecola sp. NS0011-25 TaxID=3127654 RepID=UPI003108B29B